MAYSTLDRSMMRKIIEDEEINLDSNVQVKRDKEPQGEKHHQKSSAIDDLLRQMCH